MTSLLNDGLLVIAIPLAVLAGLVSFFSPCVLPLLPGYLAYAAGLVRGDAVAPIALSLTGARGSAAPAPASPRPGADPEVRRRLMLGTTLFVTGFAVVFTLYGAAFGAAGGYLLRYQDVLVRVLGVFVVVMGLTFMGALQPLSTRLSGAAVHWRPRPGLAGAPLLGAVFGLGWTPCIGPVLAAVLTLSFGTGAAGRGAVLSFAYAVGVGAPFLFAAWSTPRARRLFGPLQRHPRLVARIGGGGLVAIGVLQVSGAWTALLGAMQALVAGYVLPL